MRKVQDTKQIWKDRFLPSIMLIVVTAVVFAAFYFVKSLNDQMICQIAEVAGEETDPTAGRLICCLLFFAVSVSLAVIADRKWKAAPEKVMRCWLPAVMGGTLLWTSVGECSWHFGFHVMNEEGVLSYASLPRIECIQGIPFFILSVLLYAACCKKMGFPLAAYVLAFLGNWYGHLCMIALYPIARQLGTSMGLISFYKTSANTSQRGTLTSSDNRKLSAKSRIHQFPEESVLLRI